MATSNITDQPPPTPQGNKTPVWDRVVSDMQHRLGATQDPVDVVTIRDVLDDMTARDAVGRERYGTPLTIFNGRDALVDAYQECLDKAVYLRQAILEGLDEDNTLFRIYECTLEDLIQLRFVINVRPKKVA